MAFYRAIDEALGGHCFNSLIPDIELLEFFAGVHSEHFGAFCLRAKRFPFNIYYHANETTVTVVAILGMRQDPSKSLVAIRNR